MKELKVVTWRVTGSANKIEITASTTLTEITVGTHCFNNVKRGH
jgi:hypothetical protein